MSKPLVRELIDAGVHFGHRVSRWNPKMEPYILGKRGLIHIIDIKETLKGLLRARKLLARTVSEGKDVLFVGTKRQAREIVKMQASRCEMPYVSERWLGGTLTNFRTIRSRLARLEELEALDQSGKMSGYSKKMESSLKRERRKIHRNLEGIRKMDRVPGVLLVVDVRREHIAVREAKKLGIPTICLLDTDGDPEMVDLPVPGNDDAMRSIEVVLSQFADAICEGRAARAESKPEDQAETRPPARRRSTRVAAPTETEKPSEPPAQAASETPAPAEVSVPTDSAETGAASQDVPEAAPSEPPTAPVEAPSSGEQAGAASAEPDTEQTTP